MKCLPKVYKENIYTINYEKLYNQGVRCLLYDLDNTLVKIDEKVPNKRLKKLFDTLTNKGFKVIIFSNCLPKRMKPFNSLGIESRCMQRKPNKSAFKKILKDFKKEEVAIIGDQLLTDIKGGNKVGITTILVDQVGKKDRIFTKLNRKRENRLLKKYGKLNLIKKGVYYD